MAEDFDFYVGIDLADAKHQACVINRTGKVVGELAFEHSGAGLTDFIRSLDKLTGGATVDRVAVVAETPRGLIVEAFWNADIQCFRLIRSSLTGFEIVTRSLVQKTIDETRLYWPTRCVRISLYLGG